MFSTCEIWAERYKFFRALKEITLLVEDLFLCRSILSQGLVEISKALASGKGGDGEDLTRETRQALMGYSSRLQLAVTALGMDSAAIGSTIKNSSSFVSDDSQIAYSQVG